MKLSQRLLLALPDVKRPAEKPQKPDTSTRSGADEASSGRARSKATSSRPQPPDRDPSTAADAAASNQATKKKNRYAPQETADGVLVNPIVPKPVKTSKQPEPATDEGSDSQADLDESTSGGDAAADNPAASPTRTKSSAASPGARKTGYESYSTAQLKDLVKKLDDRERRYVLMGAAIGVVLAVVLIFVQLHTNPAPTVKNNKHINPSVIVTTGIVGVVLAGVVALLAYYRRRSLTAFALVFFSFTLSGFVPVEFIYLIGGGYLIYRVWRVQKELTARGVDLRAARAQPRAASDRSRTSPKDRKALEQKNKGPQQSKRYTPPRPPARRPPPPKPDDDRSPKTSWFDRPRSEKP